MRKDKNMTRADYYKNVRLKKVIKFISISTILLMVCIASVFTFNKVDAIQLTIKNYIASRSNVTPLSMGKLEPKSPDTSSDLDLPINEIPYSAQASNDNTLQPINSTSIDPKCLPKRKGFSSQVLSNGKALTAWKRPYDILFDAGEKYTTLKGVIGFRGNNYRNAPSYGTANITQKKLKKLWSIQNGRIGIWTGVGWNGQPSIIRWPDETKNIMNINPTKKQKTDLKEVIYATLDGKIYFLDLDDGRETRKPIDSGYPYKGSVALDPRGYPILYAGQGIPDRDGKNGPIGYRIFNLINQKQIYFINGYDKDASRRWGAFDSGALIDAETDTMIECGENGLLYTIKLNTNYNPKSKKLSIDPKVIKYKYKSHLGPKIGTESSPVIYRNYIYFTDNSGLLQCVDLKTLKPVWMREITDDTDSTPALEEAEDGKVFLYTACELDRQGKGGFSYVRKIDALTGSLAWETRYSCFYDSHTNGGMLSSPVIGKKDIKNLIVYNVAKTGSRASNGRLIALNKETGKEVWHIDMTSYSWSSPVDVYTKEGVSYLVVCDSVGNMFLIKGTTGEIVDKLSLGANIEGSPAVYDNKIVVGTRGQQIFGVEIQ